MNGLVKRDKKREYTFTEGKENTVINYVVEDEEVREKIRIRGRGGSKVGLSPVDNNYKRKRPGKGKRKREEKKRVERYMR